MKILAGSAGLTKLYMQSILPYFYTTIETSNIKQDYEKLIDIYKNTLIKYHEFALKYPKSYMAKTIYTISPKIFVKHIDEKITLLIKKDKDKVIAYSIVFDND